jgi:hypothetical protein
VPRRIDANCVIAAKVRPEYRLRQLNNSFPSGNFLAMQFWRMIALILGLLLCLGVAEAQMVTGIRNGNKTTYCIHTGLTSDLKDCGVGADWYTYVFIGSISSITPVDKDEKKLEIRPEEIFHGNPPSPLAALTSQAACLPKLAVGDRWLFYLREDDKDKPIVLDYYGNPSLPVADAKEQVVTLRRLQTIGDRGIVRGNVWKGDPMQGKPVGNARVVAQAETGNLRFATTSDSKGRYEFPPLPAGSYKITVHRVGSFQPEDTSVDVSRGSCWDVILTRYPHAQIAGYVRHPDGSPVAAAQAVLISLDESWWSSQQVGADGHFLYESLRPGRYVIGVRLESTSPDQSSSSPPPPASLYYPGVQNRSAAAAIALRTDVKRDNIDFTIPVH